MVFLYRNLKTAVCGNNSKKQGSRNKKIVSGDFSPINNFIAVDTFMIEEHIICCGVK